ncbi:MAG TPA: SufE family protein [Bacteroidales bacterium]|nr:SufE family protein [Bacteroidales bacterium]HQL70557.1 SufE family protein [Bacteroidales bacterium]
MTIDEIQDLIVDDFAMFDDWMDKYSAIIETANELQAMPEEFKNDDNLIDGCQSKVWVHAEYRDGKVYYFADSDAIITRGIIALLIRILSGQEAKDIYQADLYFISKIGLDRHLSPTRSNGLLSMLKRMKLLAMAFDAKNKAGS